MIQLFNGDCLEVMQDMPDNSVDYVLTSPPYNRKRNDKYKLYNDQIADYFTFNKEVINQLLRISKKHIFYNIQTNFYNRDTVYKLIGFFNKDIKEIIIWEKSNPMPAAGNSITNAVEYFIVLGKESLKSNTTYTKNIITSSVNSRMPKIHKAGTLKTRAIISFSGSICYGIAKWVDVELKKIIPELPFVCTSSRDVVKELQDITDWMKLSLSSRLMLSQCTRTSILYMPFQN